MRLRDGVRDPWLVGLGVVALLLGVALAGPRWPARQSVWSHVFVVDITRSMNTEDYTWAGRPVSRLHYMKEVLVQTLAGLPCGSQAGIGIFTERNSTLLVLPVEVCENFGALEQTVRHLDWRMAWAADSNIGRGLYNTLHLMMDIARRNLLPERTSLVFMTDGHEAPPINPRYEPDFSDLRGTAGGVVDGAVRLAAEHRAEAAEGARFEGEKGAVPGLVVGVGGRGLSPIPRFRVDGVQQGFYGEGDVQQATRFGEPTAEQRANVVGYEARNAPWGAEAARGNEHYSSVREEHLRSLAAASGLGYHYLESPRGFAEALARTDWAVAIDGSVPLRPHFVLVALALLCSLMAGAVVLALRPLAPGHQPRSSPLVGPSADPPDSVTTRPPNVHSLEGVLRVHPKRPCGPLHPGPVQPRHARPRAHPAEGG